MEISEEHYNNPPPSGSYHENQRMYPRERRSKLKDNKRRKKNGTTTAAEFLREFRAINSRSLDVIYEITALDKEGGDEEDGFYFTAGLAQHHFSTEPSIRRTQTCSCLLGMQSAPAVG